MLVRLVHHIKRKKKYDREWEGRSGSREGLVAKRNGAWERELSGQSRGRGVAMRTVYVETVAMRGDSEEGWLIYHNSTFPTQRSAWQLVLPSHSAPLPLPSPSLHRSTYSLHPFLASAFTLTLLDSIQLSIFCLLTSSRVDAPVLALLIR